MSLDTAGLTPQQARLLCFIAGFIAERGISPSCDEMRDHLGLRSKSGAHRLLSGLEARGRIHKVRGSARTVSLVPPPAISILVDHIGAVHVEVADHVTADWLLRNGDKVEEALNARLAAIVGREKIGRAA